MFLLFFGRGIGGEARQVVDRWRRSRKAQRGDISKSYAKVKTYKKIHLVD